MNTLCPIRDTFVFEINSEIMTIANDSYAVILTILKRQPLPNKIFEKHFKNILINILQSKGLNSYTNVCTTYSITPH